MNKFCAFALSVLMLMALILPGVSAVSAPTREALEKDAVKELVEFGERLHDMVARCADRVAKGAADDPFNTARLIVKTCGEPDTTGAIGFVSGWNGRWVIQYASPEEAKAAAESLTLDPLVEYAVPDTEYRVDFTASGVYVRGADGFNSWGYGEEHVDMASLRERVLAKYGGSIEAMPQVLVAVCDSGVNTGHDFLAGRTIPGYDFVNSDNDPSDGFGHGTFCAGVVADGTLPNVKILPLKCISDAGYFSTSDVVSAIEYAYLHGCAAANLSLIEYNPYVEALYDEVINAATDAGMVCCVASGNWSGNASDYVPGKIERSFTVAAHYQNHSMWPLANVGAAVDITAPGVDIMSATNTGGYDVQSGTSFAAPHAAACCAMIKTYSVDMTADEVIALLKANAVDEGYSGGGAGRLYVGDLFAEAPQPFIPGDADANGVVDASDALAVLRLALGLISGDGLDLAAADIDGDGAVTSSDALVILRKALGLIN